MAGRIKRIKIRNFMTYDNADLSPKKGLNLIVGLNGSGKSSIMCAICLGLAGKATFTGRATQLSDFIKHGCQEAEIEIELESPHKNLLICRKIKNDRCEWLLNKSSSNHNEVSNAVKQFNIDTSNICQFLPQEKVNEFSRMDKKQRLENMLQAIGEPRLFELFNELKDLYKVSQEVLQDIKKCQGKKNSAEEENERISDEVQKQESRVRLKKELDELHKQRKVVEYSILREEVYGLKNQMNEVREKLTDALSEQKEALTLEESIEQSYVNYSRQHQQLCNKRKHLRNEITAKSSLMANFKEQVQNAKIEFKNKVKEAENQKKKLQDLSTQIEATKQQLIEKENEAIELEGRDKQNSAEFSQLQQSIQSLYRKMEVLKAEKNKDDYSLQYYHNQLSSLKDEQNKKMENLRKRDKLTYQAACWLKENRHRFKSNVYFPIMLEIKVHASENCKYVENAIPFRDMIAFVCEDKSDCERLTDFLSQQDLPGNVVMAPDKPMANFQSPPLLQNCGLQCYLVDLFTAPDPVMRYLCSCYQIHRIPVTSSAVPINRIELILQQYRQFFSENYRITGKKSKYGNHNWSTRKDYIMEQNLLAFHNDELQKEISQKIQEIQAKQHEREKQMGQLEISLKDFEKKQETLRQDRKKLQDLRNQVSALRSKMQSRLKMRDQNCYVINIEDERVKLERKIKSIYEHRVEAVQVLNGLFQEFIELEKEIIKLILYMNCTSKSLKLTRASNEEIHDKAKALEKELGEIKKVYREKKQKGIKMSEEIQAMGEKYVKLIEDPDKLINPTIGLDDIDMKISHIQAQLNVDEDNEPLIADFNNRKKTIENFQKKIEDFQNRLEGVKDTIDAKRTEWLTPLQKHIGNINRKFSHYFKQLSCAGEISLDIPDNADDFTKYGLQIKLKFHDDEPMAELSQTHHSGGECSVAAIVFILSLQELTEVPFRCIDEINQGMDSVNERKIYQLIADSVGDDRCSQYFLLTPKLLMDLHYPDDVAVHIIFNSSFINTNLNVDKHLMKVANEHK